MINLENIKQDEFLHNTYNTLHAIPELGFEEYKTSEYLANELEKLGYSVTRNVGTTGIVAVLDSNKPGLNFGLRADMDALPFLINNENICIHACGHDANSSMVLAVAKRAVERKIKSGKLYIVFQQAEERTGAIEMAKSGKLNDIQELVGMHLRPIQEAKLGEAIHALYHSASMFVSIQLKGLPSHAARPHLGINALDMAASIITAANSIKENPAIPYSIKPTQIETVGNSKNTIPDLVNLTFDIRSQTNEISEVIISKLKAICEHTAAIYGGELSKFECDGVIAAEYDEELVKDCEKAVISVLGSTLGKKYTTGGEDFHYFSSMCGIKTGYIGVGADLTPGVHHPEMTFDKRALDIGANILEKLVEQKLQFID